MNHNLESPLPESYNSTVLTQTWHSHRVCFATHWSVITELSLIIEKSCCFSEQFTLYLIELIFKNIKFEFLRMQMLKLCPKSLFSILPQEKKNETRLPKTESEIKSYLSPVDEYYLRSFCWIRLLSICHSASN